MSTTCKLLEELIAEDVSEQILHGAGRIQPLVVGPPESVLRDLYASMIRNDTSDWVLELPDKRLIHVPVVLVTEPVDASNSSGPSKTSQNGCGWGYVVSLRGSAATCVILVTPAAWNTIPISVRNAAKPVFPPPEEQPQDVTRVLPWSRVLGDVERTCRVSIIPLKRSFRQVYLALGRLPGEEARSNRWDMTRDLLSAGSADEAQRALGFLRSASPAGPNWDDSLGAVLRLAGLIKHEKWTLDDIQRRLQDAVTNLAEEGAIGSEVQLRAAIDELSDYIRETAGTALEYASAPECYMRTAARHGSWWTVLSAGLLDKLLDTATGGSTLAHIRVDVANDMTGDGPGDWHIHNVAVVQHEVRLEVVGQEGTLADSAQVSMKVSPKGRRMSRTLPTGQPDAEGKLVFSDSPLPVETGHVVYTAYGPNTASARQEVVAIDCLECGGLALVDMAKSCAPPERDSSSGDFIQRVTVYHAGDVAIKVALRGDADIATVTMPDGKGVSLSRLSGSLTRELVVPVEEGSELAISVSGVKETDVEAQRRWRLVFSVGENVDAAPTSRTVELIWSNTPGRETRPAQARNCYLRVLEKAALASSTSWLPVTMAVESASLVHNLKLVWEPGRIWGDMSVRPISPVDEASAAPPEYLRIRDEIRAMLTEERRPIEEARLETPDARTLCTRYLDTYTDWLKRDPDHATWVDLFMLHLPMVVPGGSVGGSEGTREAKAILMSPLHPLRLGWHSEAQFTLGQAIERHDRRDDRCSGAGILNCHALPSMLTLLTSPSQEQRELAHFVRVEIDDDYWMAFVNSGSIGDHDLIGVLAPYFNELGAGLSGYGTGFGAEQTRHTLDDLVEIYPARSTYRIGIAGAPDDESECVKSAVSWCVNTFGARASSEISPMHDVEEPMRAERSRRGLLTDAARCEIYDLRVGTTFPSSTVLSALAEATDERVLWYRRQSGHEGLDLLILDQASRGDPRAVSGNAGLGLRSVLSEKGLFRIDLRRDLGDARTIQESCAIAVAKCGIDSALRSAHEAFASAYDQAEGVNSIRYSANLNPLWDGLSRGALVAANAGDVDIAGAIRTARSRSACIWDFKLPSLVGERGNAEGYYLMTTVKATTSLCVEQAAASLYPGRAPVHGSWVLELLSRRGVPIIRQLGQNKNQAKGALGILMASQLLQPVEVAGGPVWPLPLIADGRLNLLLPVDPIWMPFEQLKKSSFLAAFNSSHADLLLISLIEDGNAYNMSMTPIEVKVRSSGFGIEIIQDALAQAENMAGMVEKLWASSLPNALWSECSEGLLAKCIEFAFRLYEGGGLCETPSGDIEHLFDWSERELGVLQAIVEHRVHLSLPSRGIVVLFGSCDGTAPASLGISDDHNVLYVSDDDAYALLAGRAPSSQALGVVGAMMIPLLANAAAATEPPPVTGEPPVPPVTGEPPVPPVTGEPFPVSNVVPPAGPGRIPQEVRDSVKSAMVGFIGNENVVSRVSNDLILALVQDPPHLPKNYLFTGLPSTGKTELCRRIARVMKLPFIALDGHGVGDREHLFDLVDGQLTADFGLEGGKVPLPVESGLAAVEYPPCVVMIDEVHLLSRPVQESLLKALEINDRSMALKERVVHLKNMTFLLATTRPSVLDKAFKSRCTVIELLAYSESQVAQIVHDRVVPELEGRGLAPWTEGIYTRLARLGGVVPRKSLELAKELQTEIVVSDVGGLSLEEHLDAVQRRMGIDDNGLGQLHIKYLRILQKRGTCGFSSIIGQLDTVDEGTILDEVEPRLLTLGLIEKTPQGRQITTAGLLYLSRFDGTASS